MRSRRLAAPAALAAAIAAIPVAVLGPAAVATGQARSACSSRLVQPADPPHGATLYAVSVLGRCSAWAVGSRNSSGEQALAEHWNGHSWQIQPLPAMSGARLTGVAATGSRSALAVGWVGIPGTAGLTTALAMRWNGLFWMRLQVPLIKGGEFNAVAAAAPTSAWAVGDAQPNLESGISPVIEHWNGRTWRRQPSPAAAAGSTLTGVTVLSRVNAWAVGFRPGLAVRTIILHWNGDRWQLVPSPSPGKSLLFGVAASSPASIWAVGDTQASTRTRALTEHWDGHTWEVVPSRSPGTLENLLAGVAALSSSSAWAVGFTSDKTRQTLIEHWNGHSWAVVPSASPGGRHHLAVLLGVSGTTCANVWAVGYFAVSDVPAPLTARC